MWFDRVSPWVGPRRLIEMSVYTDLSHIYFSSSGMLAVSAVSLAWLVSSVSLERAEPPVLRCGCDVSLSVSETAPAVSVSLGSVDTSESDHCCAFVGTCRCSSEGG